MSVFKIINESWLINKDDIYKDFDKFESGKSNILLVTGLTGSGKSTIASQMASKYKAELIELDCADPHSNICTQGWDVIKKAGEVFYDFFQSHKKYYDAINSGKMTDDEITDMIFKFIDYCFSWCKKRKNEKFIIEGIQIYEYYKYNNKSISYPIIVKGTSITTSFLRKIKREEWDFKNIIKSAPDTIKWMVNADRDLKALVKSLDDKDKKPVNEAKSDLDKGYKPKGKLNLSSFKKVHLDEKIIEKYKKEYPMLKHVRCKDTKEYICDGYVWFDNDKLVCMVGSCEYTDDHSKYIVSLEVTKDYKGYGLSKQILRFAVNTMKCTKLSVNKNNKIAKKVYDDFGFKVFHEDENMYYMEYGKSVKESCSLESALSEVIFD